MHASIICAIICVLVLLAWAVVATREIRQARRVRDEYAQWEHFRRGHAELDRELDNIWNAS